MTSVTTSYDKARALCKAEVAQIAKECRQKNQKYSDVQFDLNDKYESTCELFAIEKIQDRSPAVLKNSGRAVSWAGSLRDPASVKRVGDIFDHPRFFVNENSATHIHQGDIGTCWFVAALSTVRNCKQRQNLVERLCVDRDEEVGVYGFLFFRDGEWTSVIVDDKLFLRTEDYESLSESKRSCWEDNRVRVQAVEEYRKLCQTNSRALVYAHSSNPDETWVPLLEKAFAKAHEDYAALTRGSFG